MMAKEEENSVGKLQRQTKGLSVVLECTLDGAWLGKLWAAGFESNLGKLRSSEDKSSSPLGGGGGAGGV